MKKLKLVIFISVFLFPNIIELDAQEDPDSFKEFVEKYFSNNYSITDPLELDTSIYGNILEVDKSRIIRFHKLLEYLIEDELKQKQLDGRVQFDLNTNHAGDNSQYRLGTGFDLNRGTYPDELQISSSLDVTLRNGVLEEDLSNLFVSYDRFLAKGIESYGFVRRYSDNYMSVDERYELGVGLIFEKFVGKLDSDGLRIKNDVCLEDKVDFIGRLLEENENIQKGLWKADEITKRIEKQRENYLDFIENQHRGIRLAFLIGFNGEIEQNTLRESFNTPFSVDSIFFKDGEFARTDTVFRMQRLTRTLPSDFIWRLVLRPTFLWQEGSMTVSWNAYIKLPLLFWKQNERSIPEDEPLERFLDPIRETQRGTDWRLENKVALTIRKGPVDTSLSYQYYYDNFPAMAYLAPREPSPIIRNVHLFHAEKHHHIVRLRLAYNFR
ncbi:MAG: hypothetical protein OEM26_06160 [Saprospiraceae bacterium]|nr:hypothetical protein [Saprospiraceae bacterium]